MSAKKRILITSALPYVAGVKHLGNLVGSMLPADIFARFCRARGRPSSVSGRVVAGALESRLQRLRAWCQTGAGGLLHQRIEAARAVAARIGRYDHQARPAPLDGGLRLSDRC